MKTRKTQKKRKDDLHTKRLRRVQAVMKALGVQEEYRALKPAERDHVLKIERGAPTVVLVDDAKRDPKAQQVLSEIENALSAGMVQIADSDRWIPLKDFFRVAQPLASLFSNPRCRSIGHPRLDTLGEAVYAAVHLIEVTIEDALFTLLDTMQSVLLNNSQINERLYWLELSEESPLSRDRWEFRLHYEAAQTDREDRGSGSQPLYRCGAGLVGEILWLSWTGSQLGLPAADQEYPVYISKHALRQFHERVPGTVVGGPVEWFIFESLEEPVFTDAQHETKLVEFRLPPGKLGYFVVDVDGQRVILRTFLFLTMNKTPEGEMLYQKLRLGRSDKEHLDLDKLSTYMLSDIKQDPDLRLAFDQCGCGHLLKITHKELVHPAMADRAQELRKYLGRRLERLLADGGELTYPDR